MRCAKDGCGAARMKDDEYCYFHSQRPEIVEKRKQARSKGGSRGKVQQSDVIESVRDVKAVLAETINELRSSEGNVVSRGRAVGYLCGVLLNAFEKADLEERIAKLEEVLIDSTT